MTFPESNVRDSGGPNMLIRLSVIAESYETSSKTFQARGSAGEIAEKEIDRIARDLEAGALVRLYRGGDSQGRVLAARRTADGLWMKIRLNARQADTWKLVETGAVSTIEVQPLEGGVDVFMKSVAATYPAERH